MAAPTGSETSEATAQSFASSHPRESDTQAWSVGAGGAGAGSTSSSGAPSSGFDASCDNGTHNAAAEAAPSGLAALSDDIVASRVLSLLGASDLCRVAVTCRRWHTVVEHQMSDTWRALCHLRWRGKAGMPQGEGELFLRADFSSPDAAKHLSIKQLKAVLTDRRATWHGCFEKRELIKRVMETTPRGVAPCATMGCAWKAAYVAAEADRWRTAVTKEDLCAAEWGLVMGGRWLYTNHRGFKPDFTFDSLMSRQVFDFRINTSANQVVIGPYPPLSVTRRSKGDWGWELRNAHALLIGHLPTGTSGGT